MLVVPKTPKRALQRQNSQARCDVPRFRIDEIGLTSSSSPRRQLKTLPDQILPHQQHVFQQAFLAQSLTEGDVSDYETKTLGSDPPVTSTPRFGAPPFFPSLKIGETQERIPHPINLIFREEISHDPELGGSEVEPELVVLDSSSDATPPTIRPTSEPLFAKPPPCSQFRTTSAEPTLPQSPSRQVGKKRPLSSSTVPMTPRCARPTKAWMARFRTEPEDNKIPPKTKKSTLTAEERKAIWERLLAH